MAPGVAGQVAGAGDWAPAVLASRMQPMQPAASAIVDRFMVCESGSATFDLCGQGASRCSSKRYADAVEMGVPAEGQGSLPAIGRSGASHR